MILFLLLRRLSPRTRILVGSLIVAAGVALTAVSIAVAAGLLVHGVALAVIGAVMWTSGMVAKRRAAQPAAQLSTAGLGNGR
jgi:drug/metabolite transporter (DMT)-like permease